MIQYVLLDFGHIFLTTSFSVQWTLWRLESSHIENPSSKHGFPTWVSQFTNSKRHMLYAKSVTPTWFQGKSFALCSRKSHIQWMIQSHALIQLSKRKWNYMKEKSWTIVSSSFMPIYSFCMPSHVEGLWD